MTKESDLMSAAGSKNADTPGGAKAKKRDGSVADNPPDGNAGSSGVTQKPDVPRAGRPPSVRRRSQPGPLCEGTNYIGQYY